MSNKDLEILGSFFFPKQTRKIKRVVKKAKQVEDVLVSRVENLQKWANKK
jgi:hypothetical protein